MRNYNHKLLGNILSFFVLALFLNRAETSQPAVAEAPQPVEIPGQIAVGAILPLTGDGSFWGVNPKNGIELALKDLNGESKNPFKVIYEDDRCDPKAAVSAFRKLVEVDKVKIILGPSCSSATLAVLPLAQKEGVLLFPFSEADSISSAGENVFRLWVPNGMQGRKLAHYIWENAKISRLALLSVRNAFGTEIAAAFRDEYKKLGGTLVDDQDYEPDLRDFRTILLRVKAAKPEALYFASYIADGAVIMKQAKEVNAAATFFSGRTINSPDFFKQLGRTAEGLKFADIKDESTPEFRKHYAETYSVTWPGMQSGAPLFYDIVRVLAKIGAGDNLAEVRRALYSLRDYNGVSGRFSFDKNGDLDRVHSMFVVKDGAVVPLE